MSNDATGPVTEQESLLFHHQGGKAGKIEISKGRVVIDNATSK